MKLLCVMHATQATVLEEMPAFPDKESSLLNKLYETAPWTAKLHQQDQETESTPAAPHGPPIPIVNGDTEPVLNIGQPVDPLISTSKLAFVHDAYHITVCLLVFT